MKSISKNAHIFVSLVFLIAAACSTKPAETETSKATDEPVSEEWIEMDAFHTVMAEAFHPFKDSANLEPAKANAAAMADAATKWKNAALPVKVDNEEVKSRLAQLELDALAFQDLVERNDTTRLAESLTGLHDLFHELQEGWYGGGAGHDEHHPE